MLLVLPMIESPDLRRFLGNASLILVFVTGTLASRHRPRIFRSAVVIAAVTIARFVSSTDAPFGHPAKCPIGWLR